MTHSPLPWTVAFDMAAEIVKEHDGGCKETDTGWMSDELLAVWLALQAAPERYEKMRKALEPFAEIANGFPYPFAETVSDAHPIFINEYGSPTLTVGDFRRARAALGE